MPQHPEVLFTEEEIARVVGRLAGEISRDYEGKKPLLVGVLKGSFVFLADLIRQLEIPVEIDFVILSSYGSSRESSGRVKTVLGLEQAVEGRDVIIVEDIIDSGITLTSFMDELRAENPASLRLCVLVDKTARREQDVPIDYVGVTVTDEFVVGYGIDFNEQFRYLSDICAIRD